MDHLQGTKINIAGYPKQVVAGQPPFWRYRLTTSGKEIGIRSWQVHGMAMPGNNWQGLELGASFLLWWGLYGRFRIEDDIALIELLPSPWAVSALYATTKYSFFNTRCRVYADPKGVWAGLTPPHWFLRLGREEYPVIGFTLNGQVTPENAFPGLDINEPEPTQRLWLNFSGTVHIDDHHHALIELNS